MPGPMHHKPEEWGGPAFGRVHIFASGACLQAVVGDAPHQPRRPLAATRRRVASQRLAGRRKALSAFA